MSFNPEAVLAATWSLWPYVILVVLLVSIIYWIERMTMWYKQKKVAP